jgi:hypothetical protein
MRIVLLGLLLLVGCGPATYSVIGTERAVGADGKITVEEIEGENHLVTVELEHLPPPERLSNGLTIYVMWIVPDNQTPRMGSVLELDADDRTARARATTPTHRFEVRVTAERNANVVSPSEHVIIKQRIVHE